MSSRSEVDALARLAAPGLGAAALAGPLLQAISYRAHAERGMVAVAIIAMLLGAGARRATNRAAAMVVGFAAFVITSYALARISDDAVGSFRMQYSTICALCVAGALAPLFYVAAGAGIRTSGAWLLWIAAGAVPEAWWVERQVISCYTLVAGAAALLGIVLVAAGARRGPRPPLSQHASFAAAAAIAHVGVVAVFRATS